MSGSSASRPAAEQSKVLVVDDDPRVRELLEVALTAHGFTVVTAGDGEEALLRAHRDRPDLLVLDIRLPKRSGLEVCDTLRNDPTDAMIPIILVSAAADGDQRLVGFNRGADDVMSKPFSPKELVARIRRLLVRTAETRAAVRRARELDRELTSVRREVRRADEDVRREQSLRDVAAGAGRDLLATLDLEPLLGRLLGVAHVRLRTGVSALLLPDDRGTLVPWSVRGEVAAEVRPLALAGGGDFAALIAGLHRPVSVASLEAMRESPENVAPLIAGRWGIVAPLVSPAGLEGVIVAREPEAHSGWSRDELEWLGVFCDFAAIAVRNALEIREHARMLLTRAAEQLPRSVTVSRALDEAQSLLREGAAMLDVELLQRQALAYALAFAETGTEGRRALESMGRHDPSGLVRTVERLVAAAADVGASEPWPAVPLLRAVSAYYLARASRLDPARAMERAVEAAGAAEVADALASTLATDGAAS